MAKSPQKNILWPHQFYTDKRSIMNTTSVYNTETPDPEITPEQTPQESPRPEIPTENPIPMRSPEMPEPDHVPEENPLPKISPEYPGTPAPSEIQRF